MILLFEMPNNLTRYQKGLTFETQPGYGHTGKEVPDMADKNFTEDEKALLQAQHRLEAVQARERIKERKARTR